MPTQTGTLYPRAHLYFGLLLLLAVAGFYPSYFARLGQTDATHHFHGIVATLWLLLLILQSWLIRANRRRLHRQLGWLSLALVPLFAASGVMIVHAMLASKAGFPAVYGARLAFLDLVSVLYFVTAYGLALRYRRNVQLHARFMASTAMLLAPPALARLLGNTVPAIHSFEAAFHLAFAATELAVLALMLDDRRQGRLRAPYPLLLAVLFLEHAGFLVVPHLGLWARFAHWFGGL